MKQNEGEKRGIKFIKERVEEDRLKRNRNTIEKERLWVNEIE